MIADKTVRGLLSMWNRHAYAAVVVGNVCRNSVIAVWVHLILY